MILETPDMHNFGNPVCVPGPVGPVTGTACPTATTGTPPRTTSLFLILETPGCAWVWKPCLCARSRGSQDGDSLPDSDNWDTTTDNKPVFNFRNPGCAWFWKPQICMILETLFVCQVPGIPRRGQSAWQRQLGHHYGQQLDRLRSGTEIACILFLNIVVIVKIK
jgi:hypothetical protein